MGQTQEGTRQTAEIWFRLAACSDDEGEERFIHCQWSSDNVLLDFCFLEMKKVTAQ